MIDIHHCCMSYWDLPWQLAAIIDNSIFNNKRSLNISFFEPDQQLFHMYVLIIYVHVHVLFFFFVFSSYCM